MKTKAWFFKTAYRKNVYTLPHPARVGHLHFSHGPTLGDFVFTNYPMVGHLPPSENKMSNALGGWRRGMSRLGFDRTLSSTYLLIRHSCSLQNRYEIHGVASDMCAVQIYKCRSHLYSLAFIAHSGKSVHIICRCAVHVESWFRPPTLSWWVKLLVNLPWGKPQKLLGSVKSFLVHLYLKKQRSAYAWISCVT